MAGAFISSELDTTQFVKKLQRIKTKAGNAKPAFAIAGQILVISVQKNFTSQGRPDKWTPLSEHTKKKRKNQILINRGMAGGLMGSINYQASNREVAVGTPKVYGAIHQWGGKAGRGKKKTIPQREYLLIQTEDWQDITEAFGRYLTS